jgi:AraC-like DNA-binding protein
MAIQQAVEPSPSSANLIARDFETWTSIVTDSFVPLEISTSHDGPFHALMRCRSLGEVFLSDIGANSHTVQRTPQLISRDDTRYYKLSLMMSGVGLLLQDNREVVLQPGDMAIYDTDKPYTLDFEDDFRTLVVMVPQTAIDLPRDVVGQLTATRISGDEGLGRMVAPFLTQLARNMDDLSGPSGLRFVRNALDLVTTLIHSRLDHDRFDLARGHRSALLQDIRAFIDDHLADPALNPSAIAAANFISTRHLHGIFKEEGVTVSTLIRSRRLEHCRRDLADPVHLSKSVSAIAAKWGFVDASHFSRLFRSAFGEAPTDYRQRIWPDAITR